MKKRVYIAWSHHHVLREWYRHRGSGMQLLSFDYHTDFHEAFLRQLNDPATLGAISWERRNYFLHRHIPCVDVDAAIADLRNDEHVDFAIQSGMIEKAYVFSYCEYGNRDRVLTVPAIEMDDEQTRIADFMRNFSPIVLPDPTRCEVARAQNELAATHGEKKIVSFPECRHPLLVANEESERAKLVTTDDVLRKVLEAFCEEGFNQDNYILDFDCDFIRDKDAMTHERFDVLKSIIRGSKAITIAQEPDCVCRCSEGRLTFEEIEAWIVGLIKDCVDGVEIVHEQ